MSTTLLLVPLVMIAAVVVVVLLMLMYGVSIYNRLVTLRNRVDNAFAQIEVQLKRRHDLIPNLVETAKGYMAHERDTLEAVIKARNQAVSGLQGVSGNPGDHEAVMALAGAEKGLSGALGRMFALAEAYPDLKANQNMMQLTEELTSTENKISFARQGYNDSVTSYNTYRQTFPPVLIAGLTGHTTDRDLLEFDSAAIAEPPKVSFG